MKKSLIAASASAVALAAMPIVGVFADAVTSHTDTIKITVPTACTLGTVTNGVPDSNSNATTHTNGTEGNGTWDKLDATGTNTLTATLAAGTTQNNIGSTTFTVRCNNSAGYKLQARSGYTKVEGENPSQTTYSTLNKGDSESATDYIKSATSGYVASTAGTSYWNFQFASSSTGVTIESGYNSAAVIPTSDTDVITGTGGNVQGGQSATVTYNAGIDNFQPAGTYTGTVVYTLVPGAN